MARNALVVIDMQKDFNLVGAPFRVDCGEAVIPYIEQTLKATRETSIPVFHIIRLYRANGSDIEITRYDGFKAKGGGCLAGSVGAELIDTLKPIEWEYQIVKNRWSAFFNTELDLILRRLQVKQVILAGVQTPNCIRATAWDANSLDYEVVVLTDATNASTSEVHQANLFDMKNIGCKMMTTAEYVECLKKDPEGPEATFQDRQREEIEACKTSPEPHDIYKSIK